MAELEFQNVWYSRNNLRNCPYCIDPSEYSCFVDKRSGQWSVEHQCWSLTLQGP